MLLLVLLLVLFCILLRYTGDTVLRALIPPPHTSNILAALADAPATPGSLEENVLEVVYSSLMDELQYPRGKMNRHKNLTEEEEEDHLFQQEYQTVSKRKDRSALDQLRRRKTQLSTTTAYSSKSHTLLHRLIFTTCHPLI